jgi:hypothetical protein
MTDGGVQISRPASTSGARPNASRADLVGMVLGGAIPVIPVALGCAFDPPIETLIVAGIVGIPLGVVFGSVYGIEARTADKAQAFDLALRMALQAVVAGDLVLGTIITIGLGIGGLWAVLLGIVATFVGLLILGLPALAFTIVCTLAWIAILRALPGALVGETRVTS